MRSPWKERLFFALKRGWFSGAIVFIYLYSFPYFEGIQSANELPRIYLTIAIVERAAFNIDVELHRYQPNTRDTSVYKGELYSNKAPGMSFLTIPVYVVLKFFNGWDSPSLVSLFYWFRFFGSAVPSLLFLLLFWRFLNIALPSLAERRLALAAYAVGTMALVYGTEFIANQLSAVLIGTGFILLFLYSRGRGGRWLPGWAGLAAGAAVLVDYQTAFVGPPLFVYLLFRARPRLSSAIKFCIGAAVPLGLLLFYHWGCFEDPFKTGYSYLSHSVSARQVSEGFLGLKAFNWNVFLERHFSPDDGLFYYSPFLLLSFLGVVLMLKRSWCAEGILCFAVIGFFVYFISALGFAAGWDVGPRYIIAALPFYMVAIAILLQRCAGRWYLQLIPYGLVAVSIIIYSMAAAVFPHYPDNFSNPWFDVTLRFGRAGYLPYNLGWFFGLRGVASMIPYLLVVGALLLALFWGANRKKISRIAVTVGALTICALVFGGYYLGLSKRARPVPNYFIPWMSDIWEPRHDKLFKENLLKPLGPERR
ncbi:MAG: hypothetical protein V1754_12640 [Pseudomonadota bacterium]